MGLSLFTVVYSIVLYHTRSECSLQLAVHKTFRFLGKKLAKFGTDTRTANCLLKAAVLVMVTLL